MFWRKQYTFRVKDCEEVWGELRVRAFTPFGAFKKAHRWLMRYAVRPNGSLHETFQLALTEDT